MELDHVNLRTENLSETIRFYEHLLGLAPGFRPPQPLNGAWLYQGEVATLHLLEGRQLGGAAGKIDHVAYRAKGLAAFLGRLDELDLGRVIRTIPGTSTIQVQFYDPNGVMVEVNFSDEAYLGPSDPIAIEAHLRLADMALGRSRRSGLLKANGVETAYEMAGSGPFLVLIHGMNADRRSFQSVIPALAKHFTCVTYDQRDTGDTKNSSASYRAADLADDCAALIDHIGSPAHVWGTSFGGMIAQELALAYPQCLDRLILSVTFQDGAKIIGDAETQEMQSRSQTDPTVRAELAERFFSAKTVKSSPDLILNSQKIMVRREPDAQARRIEAMRAYNSVGRAAGISAHTLVLGAMDDRVIPPETSWALAREIPNATLTMVDGLGHALYIEDPARVGHVIAEYALRAGRSA